MKKNFDNNPGLYTGTYTMTSITKGDKNRTNTPYNNSVTVQVKEGDKVVTSNISDKYLPGLLIGYITSIESDSNNLTHSGTITPAVDFEHMDEVLVILDLKQQTESEE